MPTTASPIRSTTASTRSWDRSKTAARAPSFTKRSTSAKPSPEPPPVTSAASPSSHPIGPVPSVGVVPVSTVRKTDGQHDHSGLEGRIIKSRTRVLLCGGKLFMLRAPHVTAPAMTTAGAVG
jgi:hypothetical protein